MRYQEAQAVILHQENKIKKICSMNKNTYTENKLLKKNVSSPSSYLNKKSCSPDSVIPDLCGIL